MDVLLAWGWLEIILNVSEWPVCRSFLKVAKQGSTGLFGLSSKGASLATSASSQAYFTSNGHMGTNCCCEKACSQGALFHALSFHRQDPYMDAFHKTLAAESRFFINPFRGLMIWDATVRADKSDMAEHDRQLGLKLQQALKHHPAEYTIAGEAGMQVGQVAHLRESSLLPNLWAVLMPAAIELSTTFLWWTAFCYCPMLGCMCF
jgi:hypothetical protein